MSGEKRARELFEQLSLSSLPVGIYLVTPEGRFLECNTRTREILGLPLERAVDASITDFYADPSKREELLQQLEELENQGRFLEAQLIHLRVKGRDLFVRDSCRVLRDPDTEEVIGYVGCLVDVTEEERLQRLFNRLPIGVYRLDDDNIVADASDALAEMLGYENGAEIEGKPAYQFYANFADVKEVERLVKKQGTVVGEVRELVKKSGEPIFASISGTAIRNADGVDVGREGFVLDVTQEHLRQTLDDIPLGYYWVQVEDGKDIIRQCNSTFVDMFEFGSKDEAIGFDIRELQENEHSYREFMERIASLETKQLTLLLVCLPPLSRPQKCKTKLVFHTMIVL